MVRYLTFDVQYMSMAYIYMKYDMKNSFSLLIGVLHNM